MMILFIAIVILCAFGLLNVIIGVVVERTTEAMNGERQHQLDIERAKRMRQAETLADIMFALDEDGNNRISKEEMEKGAESPELVSMLEGLDLPVGFAFRDLFHMLDNDGSGTLSKHEFVTGVMRLLYSSSFQ